VTLPRSATQTPKMRDRIRSLSCAAKVTRRRDCIVPCRSMLSRTMKVRAAFPSWTGSPKVSAARYDRRNGRTG